MTVAELIAKLQKVPQAAEVWTGVGADLQEATKVREFGPGENAILIE
jgi:hypothetical protein